MADPFGHWRDGRLHVFLETYDYRVRVGRLEVLTYDADFTLLEQRPVLSEPWHLSYPFVFEAEGETWMLPEANKSGGLTLYRAVAFPNRWEAAGRIELGQVPIDATPTVPRGPLVAVLHRQGAPDRPDRSTASGLGRPAGGPPGTRCRRTRSASTQPAPVPAAHPLYWTDG